MPEFEDVYRGYVIKEAGPCGYFIGPDSDAYRVSSREHAMRFTKADALEYLKNGSFCETGGPFVIEDAR